VNPVGDEWGTALYRTAVSQFEKTAAALDLDAEGRARSGHLSVIVA
jgi:hypothetical protein